MSTPGGLVDKQELINAQLDTAHLGRVVNSKDASGNPIDTSTNRTGGVNKTLDALETEYLEAIQGAGGVSVGTWTAGVTTFNAYNEYAVYNGIPYKPRTSATLPYVAQGADPTVAPDDANVQPYQETTEGRVVEIVEDTIPTELTKYTNLEFDGVDSMISGTPLPVEVGDICSTGGTQWRKTASTNGDIRDFTPLSMVWLKDFTLGVLDDTQTMNYLVNTGYTVIGDNSITINLSDEILISNDYCKLYLGYATVQELNSFSVSAGAAESLIRVTGRGCVVRDFKPRGVSLGTTNRWGATQYRWRLGIIGDFNAPTINPIEFYNKEAVIESDPEIAGGELTVIGINAGNLGGGAYYIRGGCNNHVSDVYAKNVKTYDIGVTIPYGWGTGSSPLETRDIIGCLDRTTNSSQNSCFAEESGGYAWVNRFSTYCDNGVSGALASKNIYKDSDSVGLEVIGGHGGYTRQCHTCNWGVMNSVDAEIQGFKLSSYCRDITIAEMDIHTTDKFTTPVETLFRTQGTRGCVVEVLRLTNDANNVRSPIVMADNLVPGRESVQGRIVINSLVVRTVSDPTSSIISGYDGYIKTGCTLASRGGVIPKMVINSAEIQYTQTDAFLSLDNQDGVSEVYLNGGVFNGNVWRDPAGCEALHIKNFEMNCNWGSVSVGKSRRSTMSRSFLNGIANITQTSNSVHNYKWSDVELRQKSTSPTFSLINVLNFDLDDVRIFNDYESPASPPNKEAAAAEFIVDDCKHIGVKGYSKNNEVNLKPAMFYESPSVATNNIECRNCISGSKLPGTGPLTTFSGVNDDAGNLVTLCANYGVNQTNIRKAGNVDV